MRLLHLKCGDARSRCVSRQHIPGRMEVLVVSDDHAVKDDIYFCLILRTKSIPHSEIIAY